MDSQTSSTDVVRTEPMSLMSRFLGIIFSPSAVFNMLSKHPIGSECCW